MPLRERTRLMKDAGFDTDQDSLIINVVKCRPPDNRAPKQEEVTACMPFLKKQLDLVKPSIIILLGAVALKHMIRDKKNFSMASEAGQFFEHASFPGVQFIVFYHPAYILRDPRKKTQMIEHINRFRDYWRSTVSS